jgi:RNA polymerase sigma-70 factor (ECF subfamily)
MGGVRPTVGVRSLPRPMPAVSVLPLPVPAPPSDAALLQRVSGGDRNALDELFQRYRTIAYRVAYRLLGHEADALDAVQDGFVKVLTHLDRFRGHSSFKTWLLRIISNAALDLGRQRRRDLRLSSPPADDSPDRFGPSELPALDTELARADLRRKIDAALVKLPESQRQTFVLHVDGGLSYRQVADAMGISIGTVMSRLFYARQKLKLLLADQI